MNEQQSTRNRVLLKLQRPSDGSSCRIVFIDTLKYLVVSCGRLVYILSEVVDGRFVCSKVYRLSVAVVDLHWCSVSKSVAALVLLLEDQKVFLLDCSLTDPHNSCIVSHPDECAPQFANPGNSLISEKDDIVTESPPMVHITSDCVCLTTSGSTLCVVHCTSYRIVISEFSISEGPLGFVCSLTGSRETAECSNSSPNLVWSVSPRNHVARSLHPTFADFTSLVYLISVSRRSTLLAISCDQGIAPQIVSQSPLELLSTLVCTASVAGTCSHLSCLNGHVSGLLSVYRDGLCRFRYSQPDTTDIHELDYCLGWTVSCCSGSGNEFLLACGEDQANIFRLALDCSCQEGRNRRHHEEFHCQQLAHCLMDTPLQAVPGPHNKESIVFFTVSRKEVRLLRFVTSGVCSLSLVHGMTWSTTKDLVDSIKASQQQAASYKVQLEVGRERTRLLAALRQHCASEPVIRCDITCFSTVDVNVLSRLGITLRFSDQEFVEGMSLLVNVTSSLLESVDELHTCPVETSEVPHVGSAHLLLRSGWLPHTPLYVTLFLVPSLFPAPRLPLHAAIVDCIEIDILDLLVPIKSHRLAPSPSLSYKLVRPQPATASVDCSDPPTMVEVQRFLFGRNAEARFLLGRPILPFFIPPGSIADRVEVEFSDWEDQRCITFRSGFAATLTQLVISVLRRLDPQNSRTLLSSLVDVWNFM